MDLTRLENVLKLMNDYGCTVLEFEDVKLTVPSPKRSISNNLASFSDEDLDLIEKEKNKFAGIKLKSKQKSPQEVEDELLFFHEEME